MTPLLQTVFGNRTAACVVAYVEQYGEGYASQIATAFGMPVSQVQKQLRRLEAGGLLVNTMQGRTRVYFWNPRAASVKGLRAAVGTEIEAFLESGDPLAEMFLQRRRPRREGKLLKRPSKETTVRPEGVTANMSSWLVVPSDEAPGADA
jgi:hypothetical protein